MESGAGDRDTGGRVVPRSGRLERATDCARGERGCECMVVMIVTKPQVSNEKVTMMQMPKTLPFAPSLFHGRHARHHLSFIANDIGLGSSLHLLLTLPLPLRHISPTRPRSRMARALHALLLVLSLSLLPSSTSFVHSVPGACSWLETTPSAHVFSRAQFRRHQVGFLACGPVVARNT